MSDVNIAELGVDPSIVSQEHDVVSGAPVFPGTRVPVRLLQHHLCEGESLDEVLEQYPITREQAINVLNLAFERIIGPRDDEHPFR